MPLTPDFSSTESLADSNIITITDTSTGSDGTITTRRVYIRTANGMWLTEGGESATSAYTTWSYSDASIALDVLSNSTACDITVEWYAGATLTYTKTYSVIFDWYDYLFALELWQGQTSNPGIVQDANYYNNFLQFIVNLFNAENSINPGNDIYSSQAALEVNQNLIVNESFYF